MARDFYPFVEGNNSQDQTGSATPKLEVHYAARIAVYDDAAAAPRVVVVDPKPVRDYLEEITSEVTRLSHEQGGTIPFMVIREVVENFIHAYFVEPTVSILDHGDTIRFSDQGPGIAQKDRALEYGTSSATEEMRHYIRGVGSGLPYAQQYMCDHGGSLTIDDNIGTGTVVTLSAHDSNEDPQVATPSNAGMAVPVAQPQQTVYPQSQPPAQYPPAYQQAQPYPYQQGYLYSQPYQQVASQGYQQTYPYYNPYPQQGQAMSRQGGPQPQQLGQQPVQMTQPQIQQAVPQEHTPQQTEVSAALPALDISARGHQILSYLSEHESAGPSNLVRAFGGSQPTWSRALKELESTGLIKKDGQKYYLTEVGRLFCA